MGRSRRCRSRWLNRKRPRLSTRASLVRLLIPYGQQGEPTPQQAAKAAQQDATAFTASGEAAKAAVAEANTIRVAREKMRFMIDLQN